MTPLRLLYVDDETDLLHLVRTGLRDNPEIEVLTAASAHEALELLERQPVDVVLSDYSMPRMNGLDLLSEVRRRHGNVPFILFTGRGSEEVVIEALNGRADLFIRKQPDIGALLDELVPRLHAIVARHRSEQERSRIEARYHAIFDHLDRGLVLYDSADGAIWANASSLAYLGSGIEGSTPEDLAGRLVPEERVRFLELVESVRTGEPSASDRFHLADGCGSLAEFTLKGIMPGQLLLEIEDVEAQEALKVQSREMERTLAHLGSTLRQQVERNTMVVRGLAEQLSRNITDRRDRALIERIVTANEEIRSTIAYALRNRDRPADQGRYRPLLPIIRQAARAAGMPVHGCVVEVPDLSVTLDTWLERVLHHLFSEALRTGATDL
ncbi:MAG TPA: response regulator, partial [Methanoregulaceae archaeon]|nr:response regulator [Methanoregulaceae archaeon]